MHPLMRSETGTVDDPWARLAAIRELRSAMGSLDDACAALVGLVADTNWQSDGVRALHELLEETRRLANGYAWVLRGQAGKLESVDAR